MNLPLQSRVFIARSRTLVEASRSLIRATKNLKAEALFRVQRSALKNRSPVPKPTQTRAA